LQTAGEEAGHGKCPLCRGVLSPADLFNRAALVPETPKEEEGKDGEVEEVDADAIDVLEIPSSTKLQRVVFILNEYRQ